MVPRPETGRGGRIGGPLGNPGSIHIVVGLLVAVGLDGFGLVISIQDHFRKSTYIATITPPSGSKHRVEAMRAFA
jgi:hypothetical protein